MITNSIIISREKRQSKVDQKAIRRPKYKLLELNRTITKIPITMLRNTLQILLTQTTKKMIHLIFELMSEL